MGGAGYIGYQNFAAVIVRLEQPAALLDQDGRVVFCNERFSKDILPRLGLAFGDFLSAALLEKDKRSFERFLASGDDRFVCAHVSGSNVTRLTMSPLGPSVFLCQVNWADGKRLQYLMEHLDQGVWDYDVAGDRFVVSDGWRRMRGLPLGGEIYDPGYDWIDDIHPEDQSALKSVFEAHMRGADLNMRVQYRHRFGQDKWVWILGCSKVVDVDEFGKPSRIVGTDTDITHVKEREEELRQLERKLQLAFDASGIGVFEFDPNVGRVHWDNRLLEIYGLAGEPNDRANIMWETFLHPDDADDVKDHEQFCEVNGLDFQRDFRIVRPDGEVRHIRSRATRLPVPGALPKLIGVNIDMTDDCRRAEELERVKAQLEYESRHDALTGLANRRLLDERTAALFRKMRPDQTYAVLHLDLDHFKEVNDTLGHAAGDAVLVHVATTIQDQVGTAGLTCRVGGDEFAVLFETAPEPKMLKSLCDELVAAVRKPIVLGETTCQIGVSIGCAVGQGTPETTSDIFKQADKALYAAKEAGKNCYRVFGAGA